MAALPGNYLEISKAGNYLESSKESIKTGDVRYIDHIDQKARQLLAQGEFLTLQDLAVDGQDMLDAGYKGRTIGKKLEQALFCVMLEGVPNTREAILHELKKDE
jgi:hypothetical protein